MPNPPREETPIPPERLHDRFTRFQTLVGLAESRFAAGDLPAAVALAQVAARCAFPDHSGLFASPRLERLLVELGRRIAGPAPNAPRPRSDGRRDVLHVLTYARPVGGDSRFVWRWMVEDHESRHSVAITTQSHYRDVFEVPAFLREAAEASGGRLHELGAPASQPIAQALELRALCQGRDVVALHLWPDDVVPVLALADGCHGDCTLFLHHSDHTFWLGASVSHAIVHMRSEPTDFLRERRGLATERAAMLPIPLAHREPVMPRADAKRALGFPQDRVLLLTIASDFKYASPGRIGFLELVVPVLEKAPEADLVAVGPALDGAWKAASERTGGRIRALGPRWDNDLLLAAADVYLDSVPFASNTSTLEAGSLGIPLLGLAPETPELALLAAGAPGLDGAIELAPDPAGHREALHRLIADPARRQRCGERVREQIAAFHTGNGWLAMLRALYDGLDRTGPRGCLVADEDVFGATSFDLALAALFAQAADPGRLRRLTRTYVGALGYRSRIAVTRQLARAGFDVSPLLLLPPPANELVRAAGPPARRAVARLAGALGRRAP